MCYVAEPYAARQDFWVRRAPRLPIDLVGTLSGQFARFVDISEHGVGCVVEQIDTGIGSILPLTLTLPSGISISGSLDVKSVVSLKGSGWRIGGLTTWDDSSWLGDFTPLKSSRSSLKA
jgi:hypothetical protein